MKEMHQFDLKLAIEVLDRTPKILMAWLRDLPEEWTHYKSDAESWSAFDIVGHFIHGEKTDWIPRAQIILQREGIKEFEPFDRFAQYETSKGKTLERLLDEFCQLRERNLGTLREFNLQPEDYKLQGKHPELGIVTLRQLLSTWVVHDLEHLAQTAQVMAQQYENEVGPWSDYLGVLKR
jgi:uncharacterized damage-inducible protein DinB